MQRSKLISQVILSEKRNRIEDLRNELEKAYGALYTLLNKFQIQDRKRGVLLSSDEKRSLDGMIATYPFMFPPEIYDVWREKIQNLEPAGTRVEMGKLIYAEYMIPVEFIDKINEEYSIRVQKYRELLKKE